MRRVFRGVRATERRRSAQLATSSGPLLRIRVMETHGWWRGTFSAWLWAVLSLLTCGGTEQIGGGGYDDPYAPFTALPKGAPVPRSPTHRPKWMNAVNVVRDGMRLRHLMFIHLCTHTTALLVSRSPHTLHK